MCTHKHQFGARISDRGTVHQKTRKPRTLRGKLRKKNTEDYGLERRPLVLNIFKIWKHVFGTEANVELFSRKLTASFKGGNVHIVWFPVEH